MTEDEMNARIYSFPASMLKQNGKKINYHDFICGEHPRELDEAMSHLLPKMKELDVEALVNETPYITPLQQEFYVSYLRNRREKIFEAK